MLIVLITARHKTHDLAMSLILFASFLTCLFVFSRARRSRFVVPRDRPTKREWLRRTGNALAIADAVVLLVYGSSYPSWNALLGLAMLWGALGLFRYSLATHGTVSPNIAFTPGAPSALMTSGPYRWVRHPIYSAYLLMWGGIAVGVPTTVSWMALAAMYLWYRSAALTEEAEISGSPNGDAYKQYRRTTGRFVPLIG
ncbi:MAG: isoprenylcysteine carboxylmethyltransferase family protein [Burkholderiales bacterium]|nr:isoprenylcysteine carboxylmethyltransferase family protein [Burkholderiales bacterium]